MTRAIIAHAVVDIQYLPRHAAGLLKRAIDAFPVVVLVAATTEDAEHTPCRGLAAVYRDPSAAARSSARAPARMPSIE